MEKYKIVPAEREERSGEKIIKNRCKPSKKRLTTVFFGTPGETRTHNEPLGGVCYIHLTTEADRCNIQFEGISDLDGSMFGGGPSILLRYKRRFIMMDI